jgi:HEAT repeat protein
VAEGRPYVLSCAAVALAVLVLTTCVSCAAESPGKAAPAPGSLADLLTRVPPKTDEAADELGRDLAALGPRGVADLGAMLVESGQGDDSRARTALGVLAVYVNRPGGEADREAFTRSIARLLGRPAEPAVKSYILEQLGPACGPAIVPAAARFILDENLGDDAALLLVTVGGEEVGKLLREVLPRATGRRRTAIVVGLGTLGDKAAVPLIRDLVADDEGEVRLAAFFALGNIGDAASTDVILKAAASDNADDRSMAAESALLLAQRLAQAEKPAAAARIYRSLLKSSSGVKEGDIRCAAITGLADGLGAEAMDDLLAAARKDADASVRLAAIDALGSLGEDRHEAAILEIVLGAASDAEREAAAKALAAVSLRSPDRKACELKIRAAMADASPAAKAALAEVLAQFAGGHR